ncbi:hypothetical protein RND81_02G146600 [Saponaria officinalis]|uniref:Tyrosyl-DNA phosphodiesterase n=1 Tax=Saponaria officinalis TaxID=3572 RepID=A0AAW1MLK8_SAPOF
MITTVLDSIQGYTAGNMIPSPLKNVEKEFLKKYWGKWKTTHTGRCRTMSHIKTFARDNGRNLAWFLLTSANLSKDAWGALQKNSSQLMIRSYELGVLFLPTVVGNSRGFSCTDDTSSLKSDKQGSTNSSSVRKTKLVSLIGQGRETDHSDCELVRLPIPYELPPQSYTSQANIRKRVR